MYKIYFQSQSLRLFEKDKGNLIIKDSFDSTSAQHLRSATVCLRWYFQLFCRAVWVSFLLLQLRRLEASGRSPARAHIHLLNISCLVSRYVSRYVCSLVRTWSLGLVWCVHFTHFANGSVTYAPKCPHHQSQITNQSPRQRRKFNVYVSTIFLFISPDLDGHRAPKNGS